VEITLQHGIGTGKGRYNSVNAGIISPKKQVGAASMNVCSSSRYFKKQKGKPGTASLLMGVIIHIYLLQNLHGVAMVG
jgi:hypothetical protein